MFTRRRAWAVCITLVLAAPAAAQDSGNFVIQLGQDTVSVEHFERAKNRIEVDQVGRAPRVMQRHFTYNYFQQGGLGHFAMVATAPGATTPTQTIEVSSGTDSLRTRIQTGTAPPTQLAIALPPGTLVVAYSSPWAIFETKVMELVRTKSDTLRCPLYFVGAPSVNQLVLSRLGRDSVGIANDRGDVFLARVDKDGRIQGVMPVSGTGQFTVTRVAKLDLAALTASFAAQEKAGTSVGALSPRDTLQVANAGGASLWIDYGRPATRGRTIFGVVVPYGEVWRTGANAATQIRTDKALRFGETVVPAGFYTLWTIPGAAGWKLILNSETGQWGTARKPDKDIATLDMAVSTLPQVVERFTISVETNATGGVLNLDWDTTRASAPFVVQP